MILNVTFVGKYVSQPQCVAAFDAKGPHTDVKVGARSKDHSQISVGVEVGGPPNVRPSS